MFGAILRREIYQSLTSFSLVFILAVLSILVLLSAYTQARYYQKVLADYTLRRSIHEAESNADSAVLSKPVPELLPFFNGMYDRLPNEVTVRTASLLIRASSEDLNTLDWFFPITDLHLIIGIVLTITAILVSHDAITGEREQGILKVILSNPITRRSLFLAKLMGVILLMGFIALYSVSLYIAVVL